MTKFSSIYTTSHKPAKATYESVVEALTGNGIVTLGGEKNYLVKHGFLHETGDVWRISTVESQRWLETVASHTALTFGDVGKVRVGVKTTADKVFIRSDWTDVTKGDLPELLRPLTTHHIANRFKAREDVPAKQILYTHHVVDGKRKPVDIDAFPRSRRYLEEHKEILERREYVRKAGRNWYEIWVPQDPEAWKHPKVVFRDIAEQPTFWMDLGGTIVNGDCYWISCERTNDSDLLWLILAVANSPFIERFYDFRFNNKLYSGRRRFMTQYVEKFPLPQPDSPLAQEIVRIAKEIYQLEPSSTMKRLDEELSLLVWQSFGLAGEEVAR